MTNTAADILTYAEQHGIAILAEGQQLILEGQKGTLPPEFIERARKHKPELLAELNAANDAGYEALPPVAEARRQRVFAMLTERPGVRYAALTDTKAVSGSVLLTLAVRHVGTVELPIPADKWDGVLFLELLERHAVH